MLTDPIRAELFSNKAEVKDVDELQDTIRMFECGCEFKFEPDGHGGSTVQVTGDAFGPSAYPLFGGAADGDMDMPETGPGGPQSGGEGTGAEDSDLDEGEDDEDEDLIDAEGRAGFAALLNLLAPSLKTPLKVQYVLYAPLNSSKVWDVVEWLVEPNAHGVRVQSVRVGLVE